MHIDNFTVTEWKKQFVISKFYLSYQLPLHITLTRPPFITNCRNPEVKHHLYYLLPGLCSERWRDDTVELYRC